jgi:hypothetical protein
MVVIQSSHECGVLNNVVEGSPCLSRSRES